MWKHIGKNPEYVMVGDSEDSHRGKVREPMVLKPFEKSFKKILILTKVLFYYFNKEMFIAPKGVSERWNFEIVCNNLAL
jgi:hypothetical protein